MLKKIFLLCFLIFSCLSAKEINIGFATDNAPFSYVDSDGYTGVEYEMIKEIFKRVGDTNLRINLVGSSFEGLFEGIENKSFEMAIGTISITEKRKNNFDFSVPYFNAANMIICRSDDTSLLTVDDLQGKVIGAFLKGSTQEEFARSIPNAKVVVSDSLINLMIMLKTGRADALVIEVTNSPIILNNKFEYLNEIDRNSLVFLENLGADKKLTILEIVNNEKGKLAIMFSKNFDSELKEKIDDAILQMKEDGTIKRFLSTYGISMR